jgi:transcriptional regulator with PAS, ATPase and Fis domain
MSDESFVNLSPVSFLQSFVIQSIKLAEQKGCAQCDDNFNYIEFLGLTASSCLEAVARQELGLTGAITGDEYSDIIIRIKDRIGGNFSRAPSEPGVIRVVNSRCPFGDMVKEAPELCRMTSSVFGGIAAKNFGYAKVELKKRIANNDGKCEVCIYTNPDIAKNQLGDEYHSQDDRIISKRSQSEVSVRVAEKMEKTWCLTDSNDPKGQRNNCPIIVAESREMRQALEAAEVVGPTLANVCISGETGVGKEVVARAIHALSERCECEFVPVNCSAIPQDLIESLLFGHEKGAFTDACNVHQGYFERAEKGTLFLDEIDSLPILAQAKLLRVLQEGEFERVGGRQMLKADVRIVSASNRDIEAMTSTGEFRKDLYYRLNVVPIHIPPLRERKDDISELANHILRRISEKYNKPCKVLSDRAWAKVMSYEWPGNVRELENVLERAYLFSRDALIEDIGVGVADVDVTSDNASNGSLRALKKKAVQEIEVKILQDALVRQRGNVTAVARDMGITPRAVHQKLKTHRIDPAAYRERSNSYT